MRNPVGHNSSIRFHSLQGVCFWIGREEAIALIVQRRAEPIRQRTGNRPSADDPVIGVKEIVVNLLADESPELEMHSPSPQSNPVISRHEMELNAEASKHPALCKTSGEMRAALAKVAEFGVMRHSESLCQ